ERRRANARLTQPSFAFAEWQLNDAGCGEDVGAIVRGESPVEIEELRQLDGRVLIGKLVTTDDDGFGEGIADVHHIAFGEATRQVGLQRVVMSVVDGSNDIQANVSITRKEGLAGTASSDLACVEVEELRNRDLA